MAKHAPLLEPMVNRRPRDGAGGGVSVALVGAASVLLAAWLGGVAWYLHSVEEPATIPGVRAGGVDVGRVPFAELEARVTAALARELDRPLVLSVGEARVRARRAEAGFVIDAPAMTGPLRAAGRSGDPIADLRARRLALRGGIDVPARFAIDRARAVEFLADLKEAVDRAPGDARLDLERHTVARESEGVVLSVYESAARLEEAAREGLNAVELVSLRTPPTVRAEALANIDISTVLASWETRYSTMSIDSDRTYNLKVGAGKLDGHMLMPGELFSFNQVVGARTEKEGYRVAPVIASGELIDGLAGGMCQIASTLHAAAMFAGLDIVSATPHSRPSVYIPLGLDATVVWPSTDLKIRNPFDFPIVIHYQVNQGAVKVELLGRRRPLKVVFEREIEKETAVPIESRKDPDAPLTQTFVAQAGYPGFAGQKRRYLFDAAVALPRSLGPNTAPLDAWLEAHPEVQALRVDKWGFHYPATAEIHVEGAGLPSLKKKDPPHLHPIPPLKADAKPIARIVK